MDLALTEEQEILKKTARDFLTKECPKSLVREMAKDDRGHPPALWQKMTQLGWLGLPIPEEYGGSGGSFVDLVVLLEEMGRACLPGPFFSTAILGVPIILNVGTKEQKERLLPRIASGATLTLALTEPGGDCDARSITMEAKSEDGGYNLSGTKLFVENAHIADHMIVVARTKETKVSEEGITLFLVEGKSNGLSTTLLQTIAGDKQCEVVFNEVKVPEGNILGEPEDGWSPVRKVLQRAAIAKCAEMVGGAQQVLEMTVRYAKERNQFGRPIGSFQAIQHHCANMATDLDGSRLITYQAAWKLDEHQSCDMDVAMAKAWVSEAYRRIVTLAHQVHGGVGIIEDHDLPLYFKRAKAAELAFGDADFHRNIVARELCSSPPSGWSW